MMDKKRGILLVDTGKLKLAAKPGELDRSRPVPQKTSAQLQTLALRVWADDDLMNRMRAVFGSENETSVHEVMDAIIKRAQELDDTVSVQEGLKIVWIVGRMIGRFPE